jgi:CheY-like chemotaxis protein/PAS domain-containing protein
VSERPRILVLEGPGRKPIEFLERYQTDGNLVRVDSLTRALDLLRREPFDALVIDPREAEVRDAARSFTQAERILHALTDGVALVNVDLKITWANPAFETWCGGAATGRGYYEALGSPEILGPDYCPFHTALAGKAVTTRLHCRNNRYLELHVTPLVGADQKVTQLISLARDVTSESQQAQKLDALHKAGRELAALSADQLAEMSIEERVELLKVNIRKFMHDLLHYDVIEVRLLDRSTGKLEPLLDEGMGPEAAKRVLYAEVQGNGVTGFVAATGKSYLCPDTAHDPLYIEGAPGAHSSLTVPLLFAEQVVGTLNVESPEPNAFTEEDLQFTEMFSREVASAIHTLELLTAEKRSTATQSIEAVTREVALPVDSILAATTAVLDRYIGHDPEMGEKLRQVLAGARAIKQCIQKLGEDLAPPKPAANPAEPEHPRLKGLRVLVADNDDRVRRSAHGILGRWGCVVETARDGQEALTMARLSSYDAILADIRLPDLPGYEVYHRLREAQPRARVILMTSYGYDPSHSIVKARQDGLRHVLYKPFRVDQLLTALEEPEPSPPGPSQPEPARV